MGQAGGGGIPDGVEFLISEEAPRAREGESATVLQLCSDQYYLDILFILAFGHPRPN